MPVYPIGCLLGGVINSSWLRILWKTVENQAKVCANGSSRLRQNEDQVLCL
jgi:hypothetical protein